MKRKTQSWSSRPTSQMSPTPLWLPGTPSEENDTSDFFYYYMQYTVYVIVFGLNVCFWLFNQIIHFIIHQQVADKSVCYRVSAENSGGL